MKKYNDIEIDSNTFLKNECKHFSVSKVFRAFVIKIICLGLLSAYYTQAFAQNGQGYAWANNATQKQYNPQKNYSYNSSKKPITVKRQSTGVYKIIFHGLGGNGKAGGHAQVTAYGKGSKYCKVIGWNSGNRDFIVNVACFTAKGRLADSQYTVKVEWPVVTTLKSDGNKVVKRVVLPNGHVKKTFANGTVEEHWASGMSTKIPGQPKTGYLKSTQVHPVSLPSYPPDIGEMAWLSDHNNKLLETIKLLLNNDKKAIQQYFLVEKDEKSIYQKIATRRNVISLLIDP